MDLLDKEFSAISRNLTFTSNTLFKQDTNLTLAIDNLKSKSGNLADDNGMSLSLPERKLQFEEVRRFLSQSSQDPNKAGFNVNGLQEIIAIRRLVVTKIDDILENIKQSAAQEGGAPKLVLRNQRLWSNCIYDLERVTLKTFHEAKKTTVSYSESADKTRFNTIIFVLSKIKELVTKNATVTRRELFYQNVSRLKRQGNLDVAVRDVCCLLETPPWHLGIVATAKGLIAGPLTIVAEDGTSMDCMVTGGTLIPQNVIGIKEFKTNAKYILVVEKDAIFQKLLDEGALVRLGPVIIITGKGYPDVCTRLLLTRLCKELELRALALVDADPHGLEIFLTYKYGSLAQSHLSSSLACSSLSLLGARHQDILLFAPQEALLPLTELDKRKIRSLLGRPYLNSVAGTEIKKELHSMLTSGTKAEIEALASNTTALCDVYLPSKIIGNQYLG